MLDRIELIFAFGLAGASVLISLLDFAGLLQTIPFLNGHISALSLRVIGSAVGYLALERRSKLDKIEEVVIRGFEKTEDAVTKGFEQTLSSLSGGRVKIFEDMRDMWEYNARRIKEAQRSV